MVGFLRRLVESVKDELEVVPVLHEQHVRVVHDRDLDGGQEIIVAILFNRKTKAQR